MVEARVREDFEARADGAAFGIVGSVDETRDAGLDDSARTHTAGLDCHVKSSVRNAVVAEETGAFAKHNYFGVSSRIAVADGAIPRTGENPAIMDEYGTDGHFAGFSGRTGFRQRFLHELNVSFHLRRKNNTR
jgi:hypothetical protein